MSQTDSSVGPILAIAQGSTDFELLDTGDAEKLERYGPYVLRRPDPQALWGKRLAETRWRQAHATFARESDDSGWKFSHALPDKWCIGYADLQFWIKPTPFKHTGLFPEHAPNWDWIRTTIAKVQRKLSVLNLFGYTGGATLAAAQAGADVCHLDGSKAAIAWARDNAESSGLADKPIRWILDDARDFLRREVRRGRRYDGIVLDPPAFGHGPKGQLWKIEDHFSELLDLCGQVLSERPCFVLLNGYASGYSAIAYRNNLLSFQAKYGGAIESGELTIAESGDGGRLLPCGIFARWRAA